MIINLTVSRFVVDTDYIKYIAVLPLTNYIHLPTKNCIVLWQGDLTTYQVNTSMLLLFPYRNGI